MLLPWSIWTLLALVADPSSGAGPRQNSELRLAHEAYTGLDFESALDHLNASLQFPNRFADLLDIYETLGLAAAAIGHYDQAQRAFARLLLLDPGHRLPTYVAPRMREPFVAAQNDRENAGGLRASAEGPSLVAVGASVTMTVRIQNDPFGMASRIRLTYRQRGASSRHTIETPAAAVARLSLPGDVALGGAGDTVEYWWSLLDEFGGELGGIYSESEPKLFSWVADDGQQTAAFQMSDRVRSGADVSTQFWREWWFWGAVGGAVAAITVGVAFGVLPRTPRCDSSTSLCASKSLP